jgi:hypothetical protein
MIRSGPGSRIRKRIVHLRGFCRPRFARGISETSPKCRHLRSNSATVKSVDVAPEWARCAAWLLHTARPGLGHRRAPLAIHLGGSNDPCNDAQTRTLNHRAAPSGAKRADAQSGKQALPAGRSTRAVSRQMAPSPARGSITLARRPAGRFLALAAGGEHTCGIKVGSVSAPCVWFPGHLQLNVSASVGERASNARA